MTEALTPSVGRNPGPRPALRRDLPGSPLVVARPGVGSPTHAAPGLEPTGSEGGGAPPKPKDKDKKRSKGHPPTGDPVPTKHPKSAKHPKKHKPAKPPKTQPVPDAQPSDRELTLVLPKSVRKALNHAANEHGTTPERLIALVISEWLDH